MTGPAFSSVDEDAESEMVGVVTARLCDEQNGVTGKQERGNGKHQPKMF
jgi:hypothetical protein